MYIDPFATSKEKPKMIHCLTPDKIPSELHWAIIKTGYVTQAGRDPGDSNEQFYYCDYFAYTVKDEWEEEVKKLVMKQMEDGKQYNATFRAFEVKPANVATSLSVVIG